MNNDDFDVLTTGGRTTLLRLILPFVDYKFQRWLAILIRITEFKLTLEFFKDKDFLYKTDENISESELFSKLLNICPKEYTGMLEKMNMIMNMAQFSDLFNKSEDIINTFNNMTSPDNDNNDSNPMDLMMNLMSPEQIEAYEEYCKILN